MTIRSIASSLSTIVTGKDSMVNRQPVYNKSQRACEAVKPTPVSIVAERQRLGTIEDIQHRVKLSLAELNPAIFRICFVGPLVTLATLPGEAYSAKLIAYFSGKGTPPKFDRTLYTGASFVVGLRIATRSTVFNVQDSVSKFLASKLETQSMNSATKNFIIGLLSGAAAGLSETLFHPCGQINTRIQTAPNMSILEAGKLLFQSGKMFRGVGLTASRDVTSAVTTFTALQTLKSYHSEAEIQDPKTMTGIGALSGALSGALTAIPAIILNNLANNPAAQIQLPSIKTVLTTAAARSVTLGAVVGTMVGARTYHANLQAALTSN